MKPPSVITISADVGLLLKRTPDAEDSMMDEDYCGRTAPEEHDWCQFDSINTSTMTCVCDHASFDDLLMFDGCSPNSSMCCFDGCHDDMVDEDCVTPLQNMYGSCASILSAQETPRASQIGQEEEERNYHKAECSLEKLAYSRMLRLQLYSSIESKISQLEVDMQAEKDRQRTDLEYKICNHSSIQKYYLNSVQQGVDDLLSSQTERMNVYEGIGRRIEELQRELHRRNFPPLRKKYRRFTTFTRLVQGEDARLAHEQQQISILDEEEEEYDYCLQGYA
ncbi:hypothetical protein GUITHDRAFT_138317 [Guillardia theta CCMP2712]|uniref:Uncharacterized protein n=1 Tax=Guillardia theta (strain CCMP2712) TaxID=905079 RepID=L1JCB6_GUITC|nr:hypothetical protein GUITHDRAFT_138317 [Guillardia theta CCMP2712]EKX46188.1 hypothetical protein GUITHDRAFT_138317 [Guillardia theta CCMP2712]|eukprot:XP_005833168.1 hypothetical protein GUITHDRAFT_138317 [Guillardia theta CCMP2712]